ncbi:MAG: response regulator [Candidatus Bathyarchaeia archaeon]|nr:response regulator [Candidatus Bathyarchaeota archaeon]MBS7656291.1 response regulator [Candidatus Bathyarchaeota archaeon]
MEEVKTILIVDDDKAILRSLKAILEMKGYEVETAETGKEAIEKSRKKIYNLAILDIKLPDMEGTELLVKMHETMPKMMKIMLTGYPSLENAVKSLNLGADAFLMKPVNPKELLKVVEEKLREQTEMEMLSEDKVKQWMETRLKKLKRSEER